MTVTINVNGLTLVHKDSGGISSATLPDFCWTPPVPTLVAYGNTSFSKDLAKGTKTVFADGGNMIAINGSEFSKSISDEPGTVGGVISGVNMKESTWITYSSDVFIEGQNACRLTDKKFQNHFNTVDMAGTLQRYVEDDKLNLLCNIFCETREEGHKHYENEQKKADAAAKNGQTYEKKPFNYSDAAKQKAANPKYANQMAKYGFVPEKKMLVRVSQSTQNLFKGTRKVYSSASEFGQKAVQQIDKISAVLKKTAKEQAEKAVMKLLKKELAEKAIKKASTFWLKFIPVVNVISTIYDIYDVASTAYDVGKLVADYSQQFFNENLGGWVEARPDIAQMGTNGDLQDIYDYKFDYPSGGSDSFRNGQREIFQDALGGDEPKSVDINSCNGCKPSVA